MSQNNAQNPKDIEKQAGESLADLWDDLDRQAQAKNPGEFDKAQKVFEEWAGRLAELLAQKKK